MEGIYRTILVVIMLFPFLGALLSFFIGPETFYWDQDYRILLHSLLLLGSLGGALLLLRRFLFRSMKPVLLLFFAGIGVNLYIAWHYAGLGTNFYFYTYLLLTAFTWVSVYYLCGHRKGMLPALALIVLLGFLYRLLSISIFQTVPVSDALRVYTYANPATSAEGFKAYAGNAIFSPYYGWESLLMNRILSIIGASVFKAQMINVCMSLINICGLAYLSSFFITQKQYRLLPAFLYAVYPSAIINDMVLLHENYFNFFFLFFILTIFQWYRLFETGNKKHYFCLALSGACLGFACEFKPVWPVVLLSFVGATVFLFRIRKDMPLKKKLIEFLLVLLLFCFSEKLVYDGGIRILEKDIGEEVFVTPLRSAVIGLNLYTGDGSYDKTVAGVNNEQLVASIEKDGTLKQYNQWAVSYIKESWKQYPDRILPLFLIKFQRTWGAEGASYFGLGNHADSDEKNLLVKNTWHIALVAVINTFALLLYSSCLCGIFRLFRNKHFGVFLSSLFIAGIGAMLLITEAQTRYKAILFLPLCILAAYGVEGVFNLLRAFYSQEISWNLRTDMAVFRLLTITVSLIFLLLWKIGNDHFIYEDELHYQFLTTKDVPCTVFEDDVYLWRNQYDRFGAEYGWELLDEEGNKIDRKPYSDDNTFIVKDPGEGWYIKAFMRLENGTTTSIKLSIPDETADEAP